MYSFGLRTHRPPQPLAAHLSLNYRFSKQLKHLVDRKITDPGLYTGVEVLAASGYSKDGDEEKASEGLGLSAKVLYNSLCLKSQSTWVFGVLPLGSVVQAFPVPALMGFPSFEIYLGL